MIDYLQQSFSVPFQYRVYFTEHLFSAGNTLLHDYLVQGAAANKKKVLFVIDDGVLQHHAELENDIKQYFSTATTMQLVEDIIVIPGGEKAKNTTAHFDTILEAVNTHGIDRHSYIAAIGGGAVLDVAGYAAAVAHRGIRLIRIPTTVLSQNDSGVGVKNGINFFNKKNFLGTFAPPAVVFNDTHFLTTLSDRDWRDGTSEAIKVALIKDAPFFNWIEQNAAALAGRDMTAMQYLIKRCAELHLQHIASRDPFETGSSRPLDFGHWSAHKLEALTGFELRHGEAVAYGMALDSAYSYFSGRLTLSQLERIIQLLKNLRFEVYHPLFQMQDESSVLLQGLQEFREHLGGRLTIMLLQQIGLGEEVNEIHIDKLQQANAWLQAQS
ncbi:MAG: 3-dehydroquinate synthase [Chitinophagaceae bacterium]